jgi:hypothetical protein
MFMVESRKKKKETNLAYGVVMELLEGYLDKNYTAFMDNFFSSIPLYFDLLNRSTYACGTVRPNRKYLPEGFGEQQDMEPGEDEFWQSGNFVATIWQDKRSTSFLSTCCTPEGSDTVQRHRRKEGKLTLSCPPAVKLYIKYMGGVDRSDRMVRTYSVSRQSKKWWFRLFYYFLDTALANSFILYNHSSNHLQLSELEYLKQLSYALISTFSQDEKIQPRRKRKGREVLSLPRRVAGNHWPVLTTKQQRCQYCARPGSKTPRSQYSCEACKVHLCIDKCFKHYHTRR